MSNKHQSIKGFSDVFEPDSLVFTRMEQCARTLFSRYGYEELRTPIMEHTEVFTRGIGTETDVVQKEMYTFPDRKGRSLTLRPEATAGVMRAFIQSDRDTRETESVSKFFTYGPMFRYERPQKGRLRQFHQINCECLGATSPVADAEMITMIIRFLESLRIPDVRLHLNSLGCKACRPAYHDALSAWLRTLDAQALCDDCKRRMETNPLRVLDCKVPSCKALTADAPKLSDHICADCVTHFAAVLALLDAEDIAYVRDPRLVRGLDYYCRTTFECISDAIGAQGTVAGGGRYDGLVAQLGGPDVAGIGFACGMERLAMLMPPDEKDTRPDFAIALLDDAATALAFALCQDLRDAGLSGEMAFNARSVKAAMRQANKSRARQVLLIGQNELDTNLVSIKNMDSGEQTSVAISKIVEYCKNN